MPAFDWMEPKRNPEFARTLKAKREAMYTSELEDRAGLLSRLGHSRDAARVRLSAQLAWDFEDTTSPVAPRQLDAILDRVYGSGGARTMTRTSAKGAAK